ncbi:MAG TPA: VWD domain-containing protein [Acidimicrobiales bacterium]|nr:VWD domain-containing protein [Acidimicrobiales bacterium]
MDQRRTEARRLRLGLARVSVVATIALSLSVSGVARVPGAVVPGAAASVPIAATASSAAKSTKAPAPAGPAYLSIFAPQLILPVTVAAPSPAQAGAFAALNALIDMETLFGDAVVGMRVALDRAQAALSAGAEPSYDSQTNASAEYALVASRLLGSMPGLRTNVVRAFVADRMSLSLTPAQFAAGKTRFLRGLPASFTHLLEAIAAAYQPSTVPEVGALRAAIVDTKPIAQALALMPPSAVVLPAAALGSSQVTASEAHLAAALEAYADVILPPVPASRLGAVSERFEPGARLVANGESEEQATEALHTLSEAFESVSKTTTTPAAESAAGEGEAFYGPLGEAFGEAFSYYAFQQANDAFGAGAGAGAGEGAGTSDSAASYGEPHEETFSGAEYAFQAVGEFTLVKSTTDNLDIQVRVQQFPGAADVALDTAAAMRVGSNIVELAAGKSGNLQLWVNRQAVPYASRSLAGGGRISVKDAQLATVTRPDGTAVTVFSGNTIAIAHEVVTCNSSNAINLTVTVPPSRSGHLEGLLGDPGEPFEELVGGNGAFYNLNQLGYPWESGHNFDVLYHQFAPSWRISQQSSLFYYPKGTSTATFTDLAFPSKAFTVASLTPTTLAAAERVCKAEGITNRDLLSDCVYDLGLTGGRDACLAGAEARVQAVTGGPTADLPESSGTLPSSSGLPSTTSPSATSTTTLPRAGTTTTTAPSTGPQTPIAVGNAAGVAPTVAVDAAGTAYVAWQQSSTTLSFCKLASPATKCNPVTLEVADPTSDEFFGDPSVVLASSHIYVLDQVVGGSDLDGINEFVSTDGGATFTLDPHAVGFVGNGEAAGPPVALPGGNFGAGYVIPGSNPAFQANSLATPADQSEASAPTFATLNPQPESSYTIGNLGGVIGSQLVGSPGVLGVFDALPGKGSSPCPSSASEALVYAYAPINTSTTPAELSTSPGGSSPWRPLAEVDCDGTDPAVGGGPSGLGLLETNESSGTLVQYRHFSPSSGFGPAVTLATNEVGGDGTLSQDSAGDIFATWLDNSTGVDLAYSSDGGAIWSKPRILFSNGSDPSGIKSLATAVGPSGQGWAVYAVGEHEYAQKFRMS